MSSPNLFRFALWGISLDQYTLSRRSLGEDGSRTVRSLQNTTLPHIACKNGHNNGRKAFFCCGGKRAAPVELPTMAHR